MHREGFEPSTSGFVDRHSGPIELPVRYLLDSLRRGVLDAPTFRLSAGCSASELTARQCPFGATAKRGIRERCAPIRYAINRIQRMRLTLKKQPFFPVGCSDYFQPGRTPGQRGGSYSIAIRRSDLPNARSITPSGVSCILNL